MKLCLFLQVLFLIGWIGCTVESAHISKREAEEIDAEAIACHARGNATREEVHQWCKDLIAGEDTDETIDMLRHMCSSQMVSLSLRTLTKALISVEDKWTPPAEYWREGVARMKEEMMKRTNGEHAAKIPDSGSLPDKLIDDLRTLVGTMGNIYTDCEKYISVGMPPTNPTLGELLKGRVICAEWVQDLKDDVASLEKQMVPGDDSDDAVKTLRRQVRDAALELATQTGGEGHMDWDEKMNRDAVAAINDDKWREHVFNMGTQVMNAADDAHKAQITKINTDANTELEPMINTLRKIVTNYVSHFNRCQTIKSKITEMRNELEGGAAKTE